MAGGRLGLRLLLVLLVLAGVFGMHTLGHPASGSHCDMVDSAAIHEVGGPIPLMAGPPSYALTAPDDDAGGSGVVLHPLEVCLAILSAALLLLLAVLLAASQRRQGLAVGRFHPGLAASGRAPPDAAVFGLRVADLSVMRR